MLRVQLHRAGAGADDETELSEVITFETVLKIDFYESYVSCIRAGTLTFVELIEVRHAANIKKAAPSASSMPGTFAFERSCSMLWFIEVPLAIPRFFCLSKRHPM